MEEVVIRDHWSDVIEVEVKFKTARKPDKLEMDMMQLRVRDMVSALGAVLWEGQKEKERKWY